MTTRRSFILGLGAALAAPAIVRAEVLMPVRRLIVPELRFISKLEYQTWPFDSPRPHFHVRGVLTSAKKPMTYVEALAALAGHDAAFGPLYWRSVPWENGWA